MAGQFLRPERPSWPGWEPRCHRDRPAPLDDDEPKGQVHHVTQTTSMLFRELRGPPVPHPRSQRTLAMEGLSSSAGQAVQRRVGSHPSVAVSSTASTSCVEVIWSRTRPPDSTQNLRSLRPQSIGVCTCSKRPTANGFFVRRRSQPFACVRRAWLPNWLPGSSK